MHEGARPDRSQLAVVMYGVFLSNAACGERSVRYAADRISEQGEPPSRCEQRVLSISVRSIALGGPDLLWCRRSGKLQSYAEFRADAWKLLAIELAPPLSARTRTMCLL